MAAKMIEASSPPLNTVLLESIRWAASTALHRIDSLVRHEKCLHYQIGFDIFLAVTNVNRFCERSDS